MKLAETSRQRLEIFFRLHFNNPELRLPPVTIYGGGFAGFLTHKLRIGAITFGRRIFIKPELVVADNGRLTAPGWLIAHEATHVLQYEREGYIRFFFFYLRDYWRALRGNGKWDRAARTAAYLAITHERVAVEMEHAYQAWSAESHERL